MRKLVGFVLALSCCGICVAQEAPKTPPGRLGEELSRFGKEGIGPTQMMRVEPIAVDRDGFVYVGDFELGRAQRFSPDGKLESMVYVNSDRVDSLAVERSGVLFVVALNHLFRYDAKTLTLLGEVERPGGGEYLAVGARPDGGVIAVLESRNISDDIAFIDKDGKIGRVLHGAIDKVAEYTVRDPFVAVDGRGYFYVADEGNHAIFRFDSEGRYINRFGYEGHPPGDSNTDFRGIAVDGQGQLWVSGWSSLNLLTLDGRSRQSYEMSGYGLAVNDKDELYVADWTQVRRYAAAKH
jgi:tripartite motif-containing protein 71